MARASRGWIFEWHRRRLTALFGHAPSNGFILLYIMVHRETTVLEGLLRADPDWKAAQARVERSLQLRESASEFHAAMDERDRARERIRKTRPPLAL